MDDLQMEKVRTACVIMGCALADAMEAVMRVAAAFAAVDDKSMSIQTGGEDERDPVEELLRSIEEMRTMYGMADMADEPADIPRPKKIPRPPKRTGPVNKANYTANRPPRVARSCCRIVKH